MVTSGMLLLASLIIKHRKVVHMNFTANSAIVKIWVSLVLVGTYTKEDIPKLYNLQDVVYSVLDSLA